NWRPPWTKQYRPKIRTAPRKSFPIQSIPQACISDLRSPLPCVCHILALLPFVVNYAKILVLLYSNIDYGKVSEWLEEIRLRLLGLVMWVRRRLIGSRA